MHYNSIRCLDVIPGLLEPGMAGTVRTTEEAAAPFNAMADYLALAVLANRGEFVDRAFEAVEDVALSGRDYFEAQFIVVLADFALCHACKTT
jgi:hypothetical protein